MVTHTKSLNRLSSCLAVQLEAFVASVETSEQGMLGDVVVTHMDIWMDS